MEMFPLFQKCFWNSLRLICHRPFNGLSCVPKYRPLSWIFNRREENSQKAQVSRIRRNWETVGIFLVNPTSFHHVFQSRDRFFRIVSPQIFLVFKSSIKIWWTVVMWVNPPIVPAVNWRSDWTSFPGTSDVVFIFFFFCNCSKPSTA